MTKRSFMIKAMTGAVAGLSSTSFFFNKKSDLNPYPCDYSVLIRLDQKTFQTIHNELTTKQSELFSSLKLNQKQSALEVTSFHHENGNLYKLVLNHKINQNDFARFMQTYHQSRQA